MHNNSLLLLLNFSQYVISPSYSHLVSQSGQLVLLSQNSVVNCNKLLFVSTIFALLPSITSFVSHLILLSLSMSSFYLVLYIRFLPYFLA